jgi:amidohydrolase
MRLSPDTLAIRPELVRLRRAVHRHPEPGFREERTAALIRSRLRAWGIEQRRSAGTGTVALIRGKRPGPTLLIRADMDALPIQEENRVPYASRRPGMMHACGHDAHVAIALGAARLLQSRRGGLAGNVKFMFQPAEEGPGGAAPMLEEGLLRSPRVDAAFALHVWNDLDTGEVGVRDGAVFAAADEFRIVVTGKGGHGAAPHQTADPIVAAAQIVTAAQTLVSRRTPPWKSAVLTVGRIHGGTRHNIIPREVLLEGTIRTLDERLRSRLHRELAVLARGVARGLGVTADCSVQRGYPATVNDPGQSEVARAAAREAGARVVEQLPTLGAEDMSLVLREVPGCYLFLGTHAPSSGPRRNNHASRFDIDERALPLGVEVWLRLAERVLGGRPC